MSDDKLLRLLRSTVCSADAPPLTDNIVDAFLSTPGQTSPETLARVRELFVRKLFSTLHREPVRVIKEKWPFGRWVEAVRESLHLSRHDLAATLSLDDSFIERLENGDSPPWRFSPSDIAKLVCLIRLHLSAVRQLVNNSFALTRTRNLGPVAARSHSGRPIQSRGYAAKKALDLYLARNAQSFEIDEDVGKWLDDVGKNIQRLHAVHLLE